MPRSINATSGNANVSTTITLTVMG